MMEYGFFRVAAAVPAVRVADCNFNISNIKELTAKCEKESVDAVVFPELAITGYSCMDLFATKSLRTESKSALEELVEFSKALNIIIMAGTPVYMEDRIFNCAAVIHRGRIMGFSAKSYLPNYREFQESRWFSSANELKNGHITFSGEEVPIGNNLIFSIRNGETQVKFAAEICEDLWVPVPPSSYLAMEGAEVIFNLSASNELIGKHNYLQSLIKQQSARAICGYVYASAGFGESSTDSVFAGNGIIAENGKIIAEGRRFSFEPQVTISEIDTEYIRHNRLINNSFNEHDRYKGYSWADFKNILIDNRTGNSNCSNGTPVQPLPEEELSLHRNIERHPFVPDGEELGERCSEIFNIQVAGLAKRLVHTNCKNAVIGISGGLDSTLALLVTSETFRSLGYAATGITAVTMPGFGTTDRTYNNALNLMKQLGVTIREISIKDACIQHFKDISHELENHNVVYENSQARERTQILMDIANQVNGLVIGTGDLSELALGWATYNGDHMSMYGVNAGIPKTLVRSLVEWIAQNRSNLRTRETLMDIAATPISPELIPAAENGEIKQKTEDLVGPYELHDFFLYHFMRYGASPRKIYRLAGMAFNGEYDNATIKRWLYTFFRRFFNQQFKRNCLPDGPKTGSISLSPRCDWRMPSDATSTAWLKEIEAL